MSAVKPPDGISAEHHPIRLRARPWPLLILAGLLTAGLTGLFGGQPDSVRQVRNSEISLSVRAPAILRSGMVFETVVEVTPNRPVANLVVGVAAPLWQEMTINTIIPAAGEEGHADGVYRFSFGSTKRNETFRLKVDGQINPPLFAGTSGYVAVYDGERKLAAVPIEIKVLP